MKYNYTYEIQPQQVDMHRQLRLYALEDLLLTVAGKTADEQGYGIRQLLPYNYTWVIVRLSLEMNYIPVHYDTIRIETWIEQNAHMLSTRNYRIYMGDRIIGQAKSVWAVLDLSKREIVNAFTMPMFDNTVDGEVLSMPRAERLTPITNPSGRVPYTIQYSDCDYNGHCNSCKYLERMLDAKCLNVENFCIRLDINYIKEVHFSDPIQTLYLTQPQSVQYQQIDKNGQTVCSARVTLKKQAD